MFDTVNLKGLSYSCGECGYTLPHFMILRAWVVEVTIVKDINISYIDINLIPNKTGFYIILGFP